MSGWWLVLLIPAMVGVAFARRALVREMDAMIAQAKARREAS